MFFFLQEREMNDQSQIMNQHQVKSRSPMFSSNQPYKLMKQSQTVMNQLQMLNQPQPQNQALMVNQLNRPKIRHPKMVNQSKLMSLSYGQWSQPPHPSMPLPPNPMNADMKFANPVNQIQMYGGIAKPKSSSWKPKKRMNKWKDVRQKDYRPPILNELEQQNRLKVRRFYHKKRFNRISPYAQAPRNTSSYIIRAKKSGGIASLVSPCPVTPAVLPTPVFSPSREALVEMAKEEWGVDGYGSMKGLIRLRSPGHDETLDDYEEDDEEGSSGSDVDEHVEVERRLDHDLSRFEMIYPNSGVDYLNGLENRVDDQDSHIAQLEEENLILKKRLYLMEMELGELQRRLLCLERQNQIDEDISEEVVNDSEGLGSNPLLDSKHDKEVDFVPRNRVEESELRRLESSNEILEKDPSQLVMKEGSHDGGVENNQKSVVEHVQLPGIAQKEKLGSSGDNDNEPVGDVCMGEEVTEEKTEVNLDHISHIR